MITRSRLAQLAIYHEQYDSPLLRSLLAGPDDFLSENGAGTRYKHDRTTTVSRVTGGDQQFVIKRFNTKNPWHFVRRSVRPTRAARCWRFAHRFIDIGICTARPVAMIENRLGPLRGRSYYISEYVDGRLCLDYLADSPDSEGVIADIKEIFGKMHAHRISHGDMKASNLLISAGRVVVLDLDAAQEHQKPSRFARAYRRDRSRLLRNWDAGSALHRNLQAAIPDHNEWPSDSA